MIFALHRVHRESSRGGRFERLLAAQNRGDRAPGDAGFARLRHGGSDVLVDEIPGGISRSSQLVEESQRQGIEHTEIICAESHGQIMAPTR